MGSRSPEITRQPPCLAEGLRLAWVQFTTEDSDILGFIEVPKEAAKNRARREIPIDRATATLILRAAELQPDGERLVPGDYAKARRAACRAIEYDKDITLRDLRHCMATYASRGGDLVAVRTILGHTDLRTTSRYVHGDLKRSTIATRSLAEVVFGEGGV